MIGSFCKKEPYFQFVSLAIFWHMNFWLNFFAFFLKVDCNVCGSAWPSSSSSGLRAMLCQSSPIAPPCQSSFPSLNRRQFSGTATTL